MYETVDNHTILFTLIYHICKMVKLSNRICPELLPELARSFSLQWTLGKFFQAAVPALCG